MKKKLAALLLCAAVSLTAGCASKKMPSDAGNASTSAAEKAEFVRGTWNENVYTSAFFGITITLDDSCVKQSDEQLASLNGIDDMSDANFNGAVEDSGPNSAIYEIVVRYRENGNLALAYNRSDGVELDRYVQLNANGLRASDSFKNVVVDKVEIAGESHPCVYATLVSGTSEVKELMVMYQNGDYFATVSIGALTDYDFQNMLRTLLG